MDSRLPLGLLAPSAERRSRTENQQQRLGGLCTPLSLHRPRIEASVDHVKVPRREWVGSDSNGQNPEGIRREEPFGGC